MVVVSACGEGGHGVTYRIGCEQAGLLHIKTGKGGREGW